MDNLPNKGRYHDGWSVTDTLSASLSLESSSLTGAISQATLITDRVSGHRNRSSGERECHLQICTNTMILGIRHSIFLGTSSILKLTMRLVEILSSSSRWVIFWKNYIFENQANDHLRFHISYKEACYTVSSVYKARISFDIMFMTSIRRIGLVAQLQHRKLEVGSHMSAYNEMSLQPWQLLDGFTKMSIFLSGKLLPQ